MTHVLAIFSRDWADEFTAEGFAVYTLEEWEKVRPGLERARDWYFGTNEGYEDEVLMKAITTKYINQEERDTIVRLFPGMNREQISYEHLGRTYIYNSGGSFGQFPDLMEADEDEGLIDEL